MIGGSGEAERRIRDEPERRRKNAASEERGVGKGAQPLSPHQRWRGPERDQRSESQLNGLINTTPLGRS
jgi:hypothetical protein